jgi:hypothetical protein
MPVLIQQNSESTIIADNTDVSLNWGTCIRGRGRTTAPVAPNNYTLSQIRMGKVLAIQQQLAEGTYDLDKGLNVVVDRLLKTLNA